MMGLWFYSGRGIAFECGYCGHDWAPVRTLESFIVEPEFGEAYDEKIWCDECPNCHELNGKRLRGCGDGFD